MQGRAVPFGLGLLAGVGVGIGYLRGSRWLKENDNDIVAVEGGVNTREQQLFKYGRPETPYSSYTYTSHSVLYDHSRKVPLWSAELISAQSISGSANRRKSTFQPDPRVPGKFSSTNEDYLKSGWSRGHMTPAGDCKHCQDAMDDSHYLTNIVPQDFRNNSDYWNRLEMYCRDLTKKYTSVRVITGPLYLPVKEGEKKYVKYQVIGANDVAVPTHLYKVILAETDGDDSQSSAPSKTLGVFVVPNVSLGHEDLSQFQTTLPELETLSGISFHSELDTSQVGDLCKTDTCKLMTVLELKKKIDRIKADRMKRLELSESPREPETEKRSNSSVNLSTAKMTSDLTQHTEPSHTIK